MKKVISKTVNGGITHKKIRLYTEKKSCICCGSKKLKELVDLGEQPLANSFHKKSDVLKKYPLKTNFCLNCKHIQLSHIVNPDNLFKNYLYVSGTTNTLKKFFRDNAQYCVNKVKNYRTQNDFEKGIEDTLEDWSNYSNKTINEVSVLDIACNDGSQLDEFKKLGAKTYGVDPAKNLAEISRKNHSVVCDYFNGNSFKGKKFDIITAQNVFAHVENPLNFLINANKILKDNGLMFVQVSQSEMFSNTQFDTIYHEHISYFSVTSMNELITRAGMNLYAIDEFDIHGGSTVFVIAKKGVSKLGDARSLLFTHHQLKYESSYDSVTFERVNEYAERVKQKAEKTLELINEYKKKGYHIYCYGAAAKGMTFLNYVKPKGIKAIIDDNPLKVGLLTPGTDLEVKPVSEIKKTKAKKILFIILAWNFAYEIKERIHAVRKNDDDRFLFAFPNCRVVK